MSWEISAARARAGLAAGDVSQDAVLQLAMDQAVALAEAFCDRYFFYAEETETAIYREGCTISLRRYPLEDFVSGSYTLSSSWFKPFAHAKPLFVSANKLGLTADDMSEKTGIVYAGRRSDTKETIKYKGGYKVLPVDLELALWTIFDTAHGLMLGSAVTTGGIKSASLTGVGSVHFDTGNTTASTGGAMGGLIPATASSILQLYRRESV